MWTDLSTWFLEGRSMHKGASSHVHLCTCTRAGVHAVVCPCWWGEMGDESREASQKDLRVLGRADLWATRRAEGSQSALLLPTRDKGGAGQGRPNRGAEGLEARGW